MKASRQLIIFITLLTTSCANFGAAPTVPATEVEIDDPAEVTIGERLFLETRFAQFYATHSDDLANAILTSGDSVMDTTETLEESLVGPFAGQSMNCAACHLVDQQRFSEGAGIRTYSDFARRSPIPNRDDGKTTTPRNSPPLVNASLARSTDFFLHFDGEFATSEDLVKAAITGRNYGWLASESAEAITHIANIIRNDNGRGELATETNSLSYADLLNGEGAIPDALRLPEEFQLDVDSASDTEILDVIARLVKAYMDNLAFHKNSNDQYDTSPYDVFLTKNSLPQTPETGESALDYSRRLKLLIDALTNPIFVSHADQSFTTHNQDFIFDETELAGLKIFLKEPAGASLTQDELNTGATGNCLKCHAAPDFTDFEFHNTGVAQEEYDSLHGSGGFAALSIPTLAERNADFDAYLPATSDHPNAQGPFLSVPKLEDPSLTDLGAWNVFANPDKLIPQDTLTLTLCASEEKLAIDASADCDPETLLQAAIALFKTPGLRDLGHGAPYMHTGQFDTIEDTLTHYQTNSDLMRAGHLRNGSPALANVSISDASLTNLAAFLHSLNEDYE